MFVDWYYLRVEEIVLKIQTPIICSVEIYPYV